MRFLLRSKCYVHDICDALAGYWFIVKMHYSMNTFPQDRDQLQAKLDALPDHRRTEDRKTSLRQEVSRLVVALGKQQGEARAVEEKEAECRRDREVLEKVRAGRQAAGT